MMSGKIIDWDRFLLPYHQAVDELIVKLHSLSAGFQLLSESSPIESVEGRTKKVTSILDKVRRKGIRIEDAERELDDIAGIRIICRFVDDIAAAVTLIKERDGLDLHILKERDYIANMKPSGYRSYHIIIKYPVLTALGKSDVKCEIQIRTLAMNFWAVCEHSLKYKYRGEIPQDVKTRLITGAEAAFRLDNEISEIREKIMDAERSEIWRDNTVENIMSKIAALSKVAERAEVEGLNRDFYKIYENGTLDALNEFDTIVSKIANIYNVI